MHAYHLRLTPPSFVTVRAREWCVCEHCRLSSGVRAVPLPVLRRIRSCLYGARCSGLLGVEIPALRSVVLSEVVPG